MGRETKRLAGDLANRGQPARNFLCREEREIQPIQFNAAIESFAPTRLADRLELPTKSSRCYQTTRQKQP